MSLYVPFLLKIYMPDKNDFSRWDVVLGMLLKASNTTDLRGGDGGVPTPEVTHLIRRWSRCPSRHPFFDLRVVRQFLFREGDTDKSLKLKNDWWESARISCEGKNIRLRVVANDFKNSEKRRMPKRLHLLHPEFPQAAFGVTYGIVSLCIVMLLVWFRHRPYSN